MQKVETDEEEKYAAEDSFGGESVEKSPMYVAFIFNSICVCVDLNTCFIKKPYQSQGKGLLWPPSIVPGTTHERMTID